MSLLTFLIIILSLVFLLMGIDQIKRKQITLIHFIVYIGGSCTILLFVLFPQSLSWFASFFGVAKGSDLIVYASIVILMYAMISLSNGYIKEKTVLTRFIASLACDNIIPSVYQNPLLDKHYRFAFLVRVYNEELVIGGCIDTIYASGYRLVICVDDGSFDGSLDIIRSKQKQYPDMALFFVSNAVNRGPGAANVTGFATLRRYASHLSYDWLVMFDPDGQMDINDLKIFDAAIGSDAGLIDMYFGSRFVGVDPINMPVMRKVVVSLGRWVTRALYGVDVTDQHCGFRVISKRAVGLIHLNADNRHYANQLVEEVVRHRLRFREIPVSISYTDYSLSRPTGQHSVNALFIGLQMLYQKFFYR